MDRLAVSFRCLDMYIYFVTLVINRRLYALVLKNVYIKIFQLAWSLTENLK
jgi:hypothetical protein